jgi:hypothetical protein
MHCRALHAPDYLGIGFTSVEGKKLLEFFNEQQIIFLGSIRKI